MPNPLNSTPQTLFHARLENESHFMNLYKRASDELLVDTYMFHKAKLPTVIALGQDHHIRNAKERLKILTYLCATRKLIDTVIVDRITDETLARQPTKDAYF
jgi:hypothetical protein